MSSYTSYRVRTPSTVETGDSGKTGSDLIVI